MNDDWQTSWDEGFTPWHGEQADSWFWASAEKYFSVFGKKPLKVLVPLCGNSYSLRRFYDAGHDVTGVDLVRRAIESLMARDFADIDFEVTEGEGKSVRFRASNLELVVGDFFDFVSEKAFDLIYDRAAFIALPEQSWSTYGQTLQRHLSDGGVLFIKSEFWPGDTSAAPYPISSEQLEGALPELKRVVLREEMTEVRAPHLRERGILQSRGTLSAFSRSRELLMSLHLSE